MNQGEQQQLELAILKILATIRQNRDVPARDIAVRIGSDTETVESILVSLKEAWESTNQLELLLEARKRGLISTPDARAA